MSKTIPELLARVKDCEAASLDYRSNNPCWSADHAFKNGHYAACAVLLPAIELSIRLIEDMGANHRTNVNREMERLRSLLESAVRE